MERVANRRNSHLKLTLTNFGIERDPAGRPEQFRSQLELLEPGQDTAKLATKWKVTLQLWNIAALAPSGATFSGFGGLWWTYWLGLNGWS